MGGAWGGRGLEDQKAELSSAEITAEVRLDWNKSGGGGRMAERTAEPGGTSGFKDRTGGEREPAAR
ncbi:hypothetical protein NDU88_001067, partial [Pleurodeles waltl]